MTNPSTTTPAGHTVNDAHKPSAMETMKEKAATLVEKVTGKSHGHHDAAHTGDHHKDHKDHTHDLHSKDHTHNLHSKDHTKDHVTPTTHTNPTTHTTAHPDQHATGTKANAPAVNPSAFLASVTLPHANNPSGEVPHHNPNPNDPNVAHPSAVHNANPNLAHGTSALTGHHDNLHNTHSTTHSHQPAVANAVHSSVDAGHSHHQQPLGAHHGAPVQPLGTHDHHTTAGSHAVPVRVGDKHDPQNPPVAHLNPEI